MMVIKSLIKGFFRAIKGIEIWSENKADSTIYAVESKKEEKSTIVSIWDILNFRDNTQAYHLNSVIGFEEWVDMEEIRRRIKEIFGVEYKNFRSLYPYLKTFVDMGLMETTSVGGRRKWRKIPLLVEAKEEKEPETQKVKIIVNKKEVELG